MAFGKDQSPITYMLAGLFLLSVLSGGILLSQFDSLVIDKDLFSSAAYLVLGIILLTGGIAFGHIFRAGNLTRNASDHNSLVSDQLTTTDINVHQRIESNPDTTTPNLNPFDLNLRKHIELEIQGKNRKITESINYAKRIQSAILPNARLINRVLPESFILYKPRDVVSGDFPWFAQVKNEIFMAAVDCTGHGVPGALLSIIGYFLLNDIVRSRKVSDPGRILDYLDEGVSTTLKPDEESGMRDGMDISICKIDLTRGELEYAGAHRPLFLVTNNTLEELKGNKFPVGGGIFKNQTNFTTIKKKIRRGDSVFMCTDGYSDQFGGPDGRKFGSIRLRNVITEAHQYPMPQAFRFVNDQWESWKGEQRQTDDVLMIGIRL